jgi:hypothetical protein
VGGLLWIHPKLTIVALFFAALGAVRPGLRWRERAVFLVTITAVAFTALLYCYRISGLFRPEGLYIREASEYSGAPNPWTLRFASGAVKALFGARDGLFVFAPVLLGGWLAARSSWTRRRRVTAELLVLFATVWLSSAVHEGASLGAPARLLLPVAFVYAIFLADALFEARSNPALRLTTALLLAVSVSITVTGWTDWRRVINPWKGMFDTRSSNFEPSLPGNSFSEDSYVADVRRFVIIALVLHALGEGLRRRKRTTPAAWAAGLVASTSLLAIVLDALKPPG